MFDSLSRIGWILDGLPKYDPEVDIELILDVSFKPNYY